MPTRCARAPFTPRSHSMPESDFQLLAKSVSLAPEQVRRVIALVPLSWSASQPATEHAASLSHGCTYAIILAC